MIQGARALPTWPLATQRHRLGAIVSEQLSDTKCSNNLGTSMHPTAAQTPRAVIKHASVCLRIAREEASYEQGRL